MKIKVNKKKTVIILFLILAVFICGNAFAALLGAPNIFFAIKEVANKEVEVKGKEELLIEDDEKDEVLENDKKSDTNIDEIAKSLFEKGSQKIRETSYSDYFEYEVVQPVIEKKVKGITYQKRNVLYADVEKEYSEIFTEEALKNVLGKRFVEIDGDLYVSYGAASGWDVENIKVSKVSENNDEIEYIVTYNDVVEETLGEEKSCEMIIKLVDGNYKISNTNYYNIGNKEENNDKDNEKNKNENEKENEFSKSDEIFKELISEYEGKVYDDSWHKYDIKSVETVKTEFVTNNVTNNAELYKCNLTYITSDGKLEKAELAMIINLDSDSKQLVGTYENFTGTTRYTRFIGLYQEPESEDTSSSNE